MLVCTQPQWREVWNNSNRPTLALIDADLARPERLLELLEQIYQQPLKHTRCFLWCATQSPC